MPLEKRNRSRVVRSLKLQLGYYRSLLAEMKKSLLDYEHEWAKDSTEIFDIFTETQKENKKNNSKNKNIKIRQILDSDSNSDNSFKNSSTKDQDKIPDWAKSLYRNIAKKTHPDINRDKDINSLFTEASSAMDSKNYNALIDIALSANIEIEIESKELVDKLRSRISSLKREIEIIEKSPAWIWGESYGIVQIRFEFILALLKEKKVILDEERSNSLMLYLRDLEKSEG